MSLVAAASRILGRNGSRINIVAAFHRNCGVLSEQSKSRVHAHLVSSAAALEIVQSATPGSSPEAVLKACGQLLHLHSDDACDNFYRLVPLVQEFAGTEPLLLPQAIAILHSTANFHELTADVLAISSEKGVILSSTDFLKLVSESLTSAIAHVAIMQFRAAACDAQSSERAVLLRRADQLIRRLEVYCEETVPSTEEVLAVLNWWSRSTRPSRSSRLASLLQRMAMDALVKHSSIGEAAQVLEAVMYSGSISSKSMYVERFVQRIEAGGNTEEDIGVLLDFIQRCHYRWVPAVVAKVFRRSLNETARTCSPELLSRMLDAFSGNLVLTNLSPVFREHPVEAWSGAGMHLLHRMMVECEPDMFRSVVALRAANVDQEDAARLLDVCGWQLAREVGRTLCGRFPVDSASDEMLAYLFLAELGDESSALAEQLLPRVQSSSTARCHLLQRLHTIPGLRNREMAEAVGAMLVRELQEVFVTDVPHLCQVLGRCWRWLPAACQRRAVDAAAERVPEMSIDDVAPLMGLAPLLEQASLHRLTLRLKQLLLGVLPAEACTVMEALLRQRLCCDELMREVVDYCVDRLDAVSDDEAYYVMMQLCNVSGYCQVALGADQVQAMMATIGARMPRQQAMALSANLCWALAVNGAFNGELFVALFSRYSPQEIFSEFETLGGHDARRLHQIYEHFQTLKAPLADFVLPDDYVARLTGCGLLNGGYKISRCKDDIPMKEALEAILPDVHSVKVAAFGGTFLIVEPHEVATDSSDESTVVCTAQTMVFALPRMSRFMFLHRAESGRLKPSGDMMLTLRNLEKLHGTKNYIVPYDAWMDARDSEQGRVDVMRAVISGKYSDGMATSASSTFVCPPARATAGDDDVVEASSSSAAATSSAV